METQTIDVSDVRYELISKHQTANHLLPPTEDQLWYHLLRTNYQTFIWKHSLDSQKHFPSPHSHGWGIDEANFLNVTWTTQQIASKEILDMMSYSCSKSKGYNVENLDNCLCIEYGLPCTDVCTCVSCKN